MHTLNKALLLSLSLSLTEPLSASANNQDQSLLVTILLGGEATQKAIDANRPFRRVARDVMEDNLSKYRAPFKNKALSATATPKEIQIDADLREIYNIMVRNASWPQAYAGLHKIMARSLDGEKITFNDSRIPDADFDILAGFKETLIKAGLKPEALVRD